MKIEHVNSNTTELNIDKGILLISYNTPVAFFDHKDIFITNKKWSNTTSKAINNFLNKYQQNYFNMSNKDQSYFDTLLESVG